MLYNPPTGSTDSNAPYVGKNVAAGVQGSKVPPKAIETTQRELVAIIAAAGLTPTNDDLQQALRAIRGGKLEYFIDGQATPGGAITPTAGSPAIYPSPVHTSLFEGLHVRVKMGSPCVGQTPLAVNALSAPIKRRGFAQLTGGEWTTGDILDLTYSATAGAWQICGLTASDVQSLIPASVSLWRLGSATAGTTSALLTTLTGGVPTGSFFFAAAITSANTLSGGATTIDFGSGAKTIVFDSTGANIPAGALTGAVGFVAIFFYDGTYARFINPDARQTLLSNVKTTTFGSPVNATLSNNVYTPLAWSDAPSASNADFINNGAAGFVAKVAGPYLIDLSGNVNTNVSGAGSSNASYMMLTKNGVYIPGATGITPRYAAGPGVWVDFVHAFAVVPLAVGDVIVASAEPSAANFSNASATQHQLVFTRIF